MFVIPRLQQTDQTLQHPQLFQNQLHRSSVIVAMEKYVLLAHPFRALFNLDHNMVSIICARLPFLALFLTVLWYNFVLRAFEYHDILDHGTLKVKVVFVAKSRAFFE